VIIQDFLPDASKNLFPLQAISRKAGRLRPVGEAHTSFPRDFGRTSSFVEVVEVPELRELSSQLLRTINYTASPR